MSTEIKKKIKEIEDSLAVLAKEVYNKTKIRPGKPADLVPRGIPIAPRKELKVRCLTIRIEATYMLDLPRVRIYLVFESAGEYIPPTGPQIYSIPLEDVELSVKPAKQPGCYHSWIKTGKEYTCETCGKTVEPSEF